MAEDPSAAGGVLSYSLRMIGVGAGRDGEASARIVSVSEVGNEAAQFVARFEQDFGTRRPNFVSEGFMDALQRSRNSFKLLFVYLHSPAHLDTPSFCERTLCSEMLVDYINENFVSWGGSIGASEGFKMSNSLKASRYPFCAVVMAATNQRIVLLQQVEGPKSPEEMLSILNRVVEESASVLGAARHEAEERRMNIRLREEQDAAYRAALEADQARENQRREEQERLEREAAEAERKRQEEEEARERAAQEAAEKEAALARMRQEKALSLGAEPEKGPDVTQVIPLAFETRKPLAMAESIITSEKPSTSSPLEPPSRIVCHVCQKQFSQYTCPRCNSRYCSLHCYKSHNLRCTESFMRENVVGELGQLGPDDETKQKMLDILKRFHSEEEEADDMDDDDNADSALSEETIQKVLSGGEVSLDDLSTEEKKLFQRAVVSGELSKMIKPWDPWWLKPSARTISFSKEGSQLIQPLVKDDESMSPEDNSESNQVSEIPPGPDTPLPPVSKLSSTKPSPSLAVHLVDIIYSYCFTLRLYNGDWKSDAIGSSMAVLSVSNVLGQGGQPETVLEVLSYCLEKTCSPDFKHTGGLQFGLGLIDDVTSLLTLGRPALLCLLSDLQRMVQAGERDLKSEKPRKSSRRTEIRNKLKLAERKTYFIMCWVHEQTGEVWTSLAAVVTAEKSSALSYQSASRPGKAEKKAEPKSKVLIQEIR